MKRITFILITVLLLGNLFVSGQSIDSTYQLSEVSVIAQKSNYLVGSKIERFEIKKLEAVSDKSLTDLISTFLPIYVKQDAGGLATIHFRGTSPDHTAIMFNGININSLTLGHSNMSNIPAFLFDDVKVQFGSSSSTYGTDAIGGSIQLSNRSKWNSGLDIGLQKDFGSFGANFSGLKLNYSEEKFVYLIKAYHQKKKNDFPFLNTAVWNFEEQEYVQDTAKNTAINNRGILQEFHYKLSKKMIAYAKLWYDDNWHQIQPNMSANYYGGSYEEIHNKNLRFVSGLKYFERHHKIVTDFAYVHDYQLYNNNYDQIISTNTFITNLNYFNSDFFKGNLNVGLSYSYLKPEVYAYNDNTQESRLELFAAYKKDFGKRFSAALNLRESFVSDYDSQFAPSISVNYIAIQSQIHLLNLKASHSQSYKIPTFNDRYWVPGGNPDILPETGINNEFNALYKLNKKKHQLNIGATAFFMTVDNWIQWVNRGVWQAENIKNVQCSGYEFKLESKFRLGQTFTSLGANYSYTKAIETDSYTENSHSEGQQLIYTPKHLSTIYANFDYRTWNLMSTLSYTGERYSSPDNILNDYFLWNISMGKGFEIKKHQFSIDFKVNNILNTAYQNQELYAMPGISYALSFKYLISNLKFKTNEKI